MSDAENLYESLLRAVARHAASVGAECSASEIGQIADAIVALRLKTKRGSQITCLDTNFGGGSERDFVRMRLVELGKFACGEKSDETHVVGVFTFRRWDEELYGPQPLSGRAGASPSRSPLTKLTDARPIDKAAYRVAQKTPYQVAQLLREANWEWKNRAKESNGR